MNKLLSLALASATLLSLLCSCGGTVTPKEDPGPMVEFIDDAGRTVFVPENITRVAVTGPLAQIVVFSLAPDKLVATASEWSNDAQQYLDETYYDLPVLGQLYGGSSNMNIEELAKVDPQIVIDVGETKVGLAEEMDSIEARTSIPVVHIHAELLSMDTTYETLGRLLDMEEEATVLGKYCADTYTRSLNIMEQVGDHKISALYCMGDLGCNVICRDSYHSAVLDLLTENLAIVDNPTSKGTGNEVNLEQICLWNPDVVFFAPNSIYDFVKEEPGWAELTAIKTDRYYEVPYGIYNWMGFPPSVQRYLGMVWMSKILYPEYATYDLYEEVQTFYHLFFHCDITPEQYEVLTEKSIGKMEAAS